MMSTTVTLLKKKVVKDKEMTLPNDTQQQTDE
jgi:hypothetical protein